MQDTRREASGLITPDELRNWVPGEILGDSSGLGWHEVSQRTYRYRGQDVFIPPNETFLLVQYRHGETPMDRQFDGRWTRTRCGPGHFSLLSRAAESHWNWTHGLVVSHVYLTDDLMRRVARDIQGVEVDRVCLHDVLQGVDPVVSHIADQITEEATGPAPAGAIYAEALSVQLAVHLLRKYASCVRRTAQRAAGLSQSELARLDAFVEARLHETLTLDEMAGLFGMGVWTFNRHLRRTLNVSACAFVQQKRVERAMRLLRDGQLALKEIAASCGFSDQAHMTRMFRSRIGVTPAEYRRNL